jgi:hypothetical protein
MKTERMDQRFQSSSPHTCGHFTAQQARRGAGQEHLDFLRVQQPPRKRLPSHDSLYFIGKEICFPRVPETRLNAKELLYDPG